MTILSMLLSDVTSRETGNARLPRAQIRAAVSFAAGILPGSSVTTTSAPACARAMEISFPSPEPPPVTNAIFPSIRKEVGVVAEEVWFCFNSVFDFGFTIRPHCRISLAMVCKKRGEIDCCDPIDDYIPLLVFDRMELTWISLDQNSRTNCPAIAYTHPSSPSIYLFSSSKYCLKFPFNPIVWEWEVWNRLGSPVNLHHRNG